MQDLHDLSNAGNGKITFTVFQNDNNTPLSKTITHQNGQFVKLPAAEMVSGSFSTVGVASIDEFAAIIAGDRYGTDCAACYGVAAYPFGKAASESFIADGRADGAIARNKKNFTFRAGAPGIFLGDIDPLPGADHKPASFYDDIICNSWPSLRHVRRFYTPSASSEIYNAITGELVSPKTAYHMHFVVDDAAMIPDVGAAISIALIEAGHGHIVLAKNGTRMLRTILDMNVWQSNRLDFAFGPVLADDLRQDITLEWFGHEAMLAASGKGRGDLTQWKKTSRVFKRLMDAAKPDAETTGAAWEDGRVREAVAGGMTEDQARRIYHAARLGGSLIGGFVVYLPDWRRVTVDEILSMPHAWNGVVCRDPMDPHYGAGDCARIYCAGQHSYPCINSLAHGGAHYKLELSTDRIMAAPAASSPPVQAVPMLPLSTAGISPPPLPLPRPAPALPPAPGSLVPVPPPPVTSAPAGLWQPPTIGGTMTYDELTGHIQAVAAHERVPEKEFKELTVEIPRWLASQDYTAGQVDAVIKALAKATKCGIKPIKAEYSFAKQALAAETGGTESLDLGVARDVLHKVYDEARSAINSKQCLRTWTGGYWREEEPQTIKRHVIAQTEARGAGEAVSKNFVASALDLFMTEAFRGDVEFNKETGSTFINVKNGELHLANGKWELRPAVREHYRTSQIPVAFDATATAPVFSAFLDDVFLGDYDAHEKRRAVLEMMGYSLMNSAHYDRFIILVGSGANGKSVVMAVVRALLGAESVCAVQPSQFDNRFQRGYMLDKLANVVTEVSKGSTVSDELIKAMCSGEPVTAERKHGHPFTFPSFATLWFGQNELQEVKDFSDGLFRRAIMIQFNRAYGRKGQPISGISHRVADADANPELRLIEKLQGPLAAELPGILNMVLAAASDFIARGAIDPPHSSAAKLREWHLNNDQVAAFVMEACICDPAYETSSSELYSAYRGWATSQSIVHTVSNKTFSQRLTDIAPVEKIAKNNGKFFKGIAPTTLAWKMVPPPPPPPLI